MWQIHPADSPHRNGAAEAAVDVAKRALQTLDKNTMLSYSEFQRVLFTAANLAEERNTYKIHYLCKPPAE